MLSRADIEYKELLRGFGQGERNILGKLYKRNKMYVTKKVFFTG